MTERIPTLDHVWSDTGQAEPVPLITTRPTPTYAPTRKAARVLKRAERTMRARARDHHHRGIAEMRGGDWWFHVQRCWMLRHDDTGALDDDVHGRMVPRVIFYYTDTGLAP